MFVNRSDRKRYKVQRPDLNITHVRVSWCVVKVVTDTKLVYFVSFQMSSISCILKIPIVVCLCSLTHSEPV